MSESVTLVRFCGSNIYMSEIIRELGTACRLVTDRGDGLQISRVSATMLNKQSRVIDNG
jgi:hypothetical protein